MKKIVLFICALLSTVAVNAQGHFGVMGGANLSTSSAKDADCRVGGFVGGLYDVQLTRNFYLQPRLVFSYQENQRKAVNTSVTPNSDLGNEFVSQWGLTLPVLASFRFNLSDNTSLRLNAGPYLQYALFGKERTVSHYYSQEGSMPVATLSQKKSWHHDFGDKLTYGTQVGVQFEYMKFFVTADYKHSFRRSILNMDGFENTIQLGLGYRF